MAIGINGQYFFGFEDLDLGVNELTVGSINRASGNLTLEIGGVAQMTLDGTNIRPNVNLFMSNDKIIQMPDNADISLGSGNDSRIDWSSQQTNDGVVWGLGNTSKYLVLCDSSDRNYDFDHANQTNPTLFIHSNTNPDIANDEWISITHDVTDGVIDCGSGTLNLGGTANVNFAGATRTVATVTHDAYVTLKIGGVAYKFMLGS